MRADKTQTRPQPKMTPQVQTVLKSFLDDPETEHFGLDLIAATGMLSGTVYPILSRLEAAGWLESHLVDVHYEDLGRRARRFFRLTTEGHQKARSALEAAEKRADDQRSKSRVRLLAESQPS
jgi:DNA-binding PadR family transcriptional regulator